MPAGTIVVGGLFVGIKLGDAPLQIVTASTGTTGFELTVTVTVNVAPVQVPDNGVTV